MSSRPFHNSSALINRLPTKLRTNIHNRYALLVWGLFPAWGDHFKIYYLMTNAEAEDEDGQGHITQLWASHATPLWQSNLFKLNWLLCYVVFAR